ncbi:hypothetical protein DYB30_005264 [Aphanomyces astaci]|uniref:Uncharacterized protein n=4 Tax=Aphanomyces astaci TaxID=112090 RepID=A0A397D7W3_APHAT|nr:hypothetical protein DYB30_005264 [Aphanomyces astaci]RHZ22680.1 hypothetical protein DYB26_001752 [Aphanomyces astaci]
MADYSKWDKLEDSDDEAQVQTNRPPAAAASSPVVPSALQQMEALRNKAQIHMEKGEFAQGCVIYKDLLQGAGADTPAGFIESCRMNLSIALIKLDRNLEVIPVLSEVLTANPKLVKALHFRGHAFMSAGFLEEAEKDLKAAKTALPDDEGVDGDLAALEVAKVADVHLKALMAKANETFQAGDLQETIKNFTTALAEAEKVKRRDVCGAIYGSLGMVYFKDEKFREAIPHFVKALQDLPNPERRIEFLEGLAACHTSLGEGEMCIKALESAIMIGVQAGAPAPRMVKLLLHAVRSCGMLKLTEPGIKYATKAREIATAAEQWEVVFQCNEWIARLHTENEDPESALIHITEAFQEGVARTDLTSCLQLMHIQLHVLKVTDPMKHINLVESTHAFFKSQNEVKGVLGCLEVLLVYNINQFKAATNDHDNDPAAYLSALEDLWGQLRAVPFAPLEHEEKFGVLKLLQLYADFNVEHDSKDACRKVLHEVLALANSMAPIPPQHVIAEVYKKLTALSEDPAEQLENITAVEASLRQFQIDVDARIQNDQKSEILTKIAGDIADTLCNKAFVQAEQGLIDDAEKTLEETSALCETNSIQNSRINCLSQIARGILCLKKGNQDGAEDNFRKGVALAEAVNDDEVLKQVHELVNDAKAKGGIQVTTNTPVKEAAQVPKKAAAAASTPKTYPGTAIRKKDAAGFDLSDHIPLLVFIAFLAIFFHLVSQ